MSRARRYELVEIEKADGLVGWGLAGECVAPECGRSDGHWGRPDCGHWPLLPGWWPTRELAEAQAALWQRRQRLLLDNGFDLAPARTGAA